MSEQGLSSSRVCSAGSPLCALFRKTLGILSLKRFNTKSPAASAQCHPARLLKSRVGVWGPVVVSASSQICCGEERETGTRLHISEDDC